VRRGVSLVEILLALVVLASLLVITFDMVRSSTATTRHGRDRAVTRMVLLDALALLEGLGLADLEARTSAAALYAMLHGRAMLMPEPERALYTDQVREVLPRVSAKIEPLADDERPGLVRVQLSADVPGHDAVHVVSLVRPAARTLLPTTPVGPCLPAGGPDAP
jgi:prepilin-type N-terminal cleavage/methylation domain-containing protein